MDLVLYLKYLSPSQKLKVNAIKKTKLSHKREKVAIARKLKKAHLEEQKAKTMEEFKKQKERINADR